MTRNPGVAFCGQISDMNSERWDVYLGARCHISPSRDRRNLHFPQIIAHMVTSALRVRAECEVRGSKRKERACAAPLRGWNPPHTHRIEMFAAEESQSDHERTRRAFARRTARREARAHGCAALVTFRWCVLSPGLRARGGVARQSRRASYCS